MFLTVCRPPSLVETTRDHPGQTLGREPAGFMVQRHPKPRTNTLTTGQTVAIGRSDGDIEQPVVSRRMR
jgi:hypothetical protein